MYIENNVKKKNLETRRSKENLRLFINYKHFLEDAGTISMWTFFLAENTRFRKSFKIYIM